ARQMVWIALGLLALMTTIVALATAGGRWTMKIWRRDGNTLQAWLDHEARRHGAAVLDQDHQPVPPRPFVLIRPPAQSKNAPTNLAQLKEAGKATARDRQPPPVSTPALADEPAENHYVTVLAPKSAWQDPILNAYQQVLDRSGLVVFSNSIFSVFLSF